jgi:hypothetical protein
MATVTPPPFDFDAWFSSNVEILDVEKKARVKEYLISIDCNTKAALVGYNPGSCRFPGWTAGMLYAVRSAIEDLRKNKIAKGRVEFDFNSWIDHALRAVTEEKKILARNSLIEQDCNTAGALMGMHVGSRPTLSDYPTLTTGMVVMIYYSADVLNTSRDLYAAEIFDFDQWFTTVEIEDETKRNFVKTFLVDNDFTTIGSLLFAGIAIHGGEGKGWSIGMKNALRAAILGLREACSARKGVSVGPPAARGIMSYFPVAVATTTPGEVHATIPTTLYFNMDGKITPFTFPAGAIVGQTFTYTKAPMPK